MIRLRLETMMAVLLLSASCGRDELPDQNPDGSAGGQDATSGGLPDAGMPDGQPDGAPPDATGGAKDAAPAGIVIDTVVTEEGSAQIRQGAGARLVIAGSGLGDVTSVLVGELGTTLVSVTADEVRADIEVAHGTAPGPRTVTVAGPAGSGSLADAIEITPFVVAPEAAPGGRGTFESPYVLCDPDVLTAEPGDTLLLLTGDHLCASGDVPELLLPGGVAVAGEGRDATLVGDLDRSFSGFRFYPSPTGAMTTVRDLTLVAPSLLVGGAIEIEPPNLIEPPDVLEVVNVAIQGRGVFLGPEGQGNVRLERYRFLGGEVALELQGGGDIEIADSEFAGCETCIAADFGLLDVAGSRFDDCGTGVFVARGAAGFFADTTFAGCDLGIQLGTFPLPNNSSPGINLASCEFVDNTVGLALDDGFAQLIDTVIRDDELTLRPSLRGIDARSVVVSITGGEITGQELSGFRYSQFGSGLQADMTGLLIEGGEIGIDLVGGEVSSTLDLEDAIIRDQTVASIRYGGDDHINMFLLGSELSVLSGVAFDYARSDNDDQPVIATGTTLNGNSYDGQLIEGPAENLPDYRIADFNFIQF